MSQIGKMEIKMGMNKFIVALGLGSAVLLASSASFAHDYSECRSERSKNSVVGGFLGAGAGAALGKAIAAAGVRPEGIALGAVTGAIIGAKIGKDTVSCDGHAYTQDGGRAYGDHYYNGHAQQTGGWYQPSPYGYYGGGVAVAQPQPMPVMQEQVIVEQYSTGMQYVPAPQMQYAQPVQYAPQMQYAQPVQYVPQAAPSCGYWVCQ
jgi:hypothetical protein